MYLGSFTLLLPLHKAKWVQLNGKTLQVLKNSLMYIANNDFGNAYVSNHAELKNTKNNKALLYLLFKGRQSLSSLQLCQKCFLRKQLFFSPVSGAYVLCGQMWNERIMSNCLWAPISILTCYVKRNMYIHSICSRKSCFFDLYKNHSHNSHG